MRIRRTVSIIASLLLPLSFVFLTPSPALAACGDTQRNVQAWTSNTNGNTQHFGTKASTGIWVPPSPPSPDCVRVSSLLVDAGGGSWAEIGWFMDPTVLSSCHYPASGTQPRQFVAYGKNGVLHCPISGTPPLWNPGSNYQAAHVEEVTDPSTCTPLHNRWDWVVAGSGTVRTEIDTLDFCIGASVTNGERYPPEANAKADFQGLKVKGSGGSWIAWSDSHVCGDNDSNFDNIFHTAKDHVGVDSDPPDEQDSSICY